MQIAVVQMTSQPDIAANLATAFERLEHAASRGAVLAVLPENFATLGCGDARAIARAEARGEGPVLPWLSRTAKDLGLWLVGGTLPLPPEGQPDANPRACSLLIDADGQRVARYDKLHLFDAEVADSRGRYGESSDYDRGHTLVVADTPVGRLGMTVCYDLRFAELYLALREAGAELLSVPSAFTAVTGEAHWRPLLQARAIETQCYLLAAAQGGTHPGGRVTHGHSAIVDPWGRLLSVCQDGETVLVERRDPANQAAIRQRMPVMRHRRFTVPRLRGDSESV